MTKAEAEKHGRQSGKDVAESIHNEVPYERLAKVLNKYRKRAAWEDHKDHTERIDHYMRHYNVPESRRADFFRGFVAGGVKEIKENIAHDLKIGYLKEV